VSCLQLRPGVLCALAAVILARCVIHRPWRRWLVLSGKGLTRAVALMIAGLMIAALIHVLEQARPRTWSGAWYR
jgi:hypothetical protein